jgi:type I restriction enzyme S subunit
LIEIAISQDLTGVILDKKRILPEFLVRYLHNPKVLQALESNARGSTIKGLQRSDLERIEIPLPSIPVQRQIVAVLEQAQAVKRQRQEADALTGALLQSVFLEMFGDPVRNEKGWIQVKLGEICGITSGHGFKFDEYSDDGVKLLRINNVTFGKIVWDQIAFLPETYIKEYPKLVLKEGDILIALNRPILGDQLKIGIMKKIDSPAILYQRVGRIDIRNNKKVDPVFLYQLMRTIFFLNELSARLSGSDQPYINPTEMVKITIPLPPLALQQQFARIVESVERIREHQAASGKEIEGLCEGLMARAFAGELVSETN